MGFFTRLALFLFLLRAHLGRSYSHNTRHKGHHAHSIFVDSPRRFNRGFLEQYARKSVDEFNKQSSPEFRYTLLGIIGAKANEETKSLEIMARFGRTRCQRTEDRYFCETSPELKVIDEKLVKINIKKKTPATDSIEYNFEEKPASSLPVVQKLYKDTINE